MSETVWRATVHKAFFPQGVARGLYLSTSGRSNSYQERRGVPLVNDEWLSNQKTTSHQFNNAVLLTYLRSSLVLLLTNIITFLFFGLQITFS